jgi:hypothetical protein
MPTVKGMAGPYRFFFYSFDCNEPMHVHVQMLNSKLIEPPFPDYFEPPFSFSLCMNHGAVKIG